MEEKLTPIERDKTISEAVENVGAYNDNEIEAINEVERVIPIVVENATPEPSVAMVQVVENKTVNSASHVIEPKSTSNKLGLVGFICLVLAYVFCLIGGGLVFWPIGTVLSAAGLFKKPRLWGILGISLSLMYIPIIMLLFSIIPAAFTAVISALGPIAGVLTALAPFLVLLLPFLLE